MADIPDERKRQIRAEEEARAQAEAEERYREQVRRELAGGAKPTPEPARAPRGPRRRGRGLVAIGAILVAAGIVGIVVGATRKAPRDPDAEIVAKGDGPLAPATPPWKPEKLGYADLVYAGGTVTESPDRGTTTLGAVAVQAAATPPIALPGTGTGSATAADTPFDPLLRHVPADAFALVAIDVNRARSSPALMQGIDMLVRQSGLEDRITRLGILDAASAIVIAGVPSGPRRDPWPVIVVRGTFDTSRIPTSSEVGVDRDMVIVSAPEVLSRALAAAATPAELATALRSTSTGATLIGAIRMIDDMKPELSQLTPDLAKLQWLAGSLEASSGYRLSASAVFPDDMTAAKLAIAISMGGAVIRSQLPSPAIATAFQKLSFIAVGPAVKISALWTDQDLEALISAAR